MVELILKDTIVNLYTSIKELPITKYQDFCKLAMIDYGVGSDMAAYNAHFTKLHNLLLLNKNSDAINEMKNIHNNYFYVINNIGAWSFCFAPFIATINGKEYTYEVAYEGGKVEKKKVSANTANKFMSNKLDLRVVPVPPQQPTRPPKKIGDMKLAPRTKGKLY